MVAVQDGGLVPQVRGIEALVGAAIVPLLQLEQAIESAASPVLADIVRALTIAEQLDALDEAASLEG